LSLLLVPVNLLLLILFANWLYPNSIVDPENWTTS
jgi:hypothetical protein